MRVKCRQADLKSPSEFSEFPDVADDARPLRGPQDDGMLRRLGGAAEAQRPAGPAVFRWGEIRACVWRCNGGYRCVLFCVWGVEKGNAGQAVPLFHFCHNLAQLNLLHTNSLTNKHADVNDMQAEQVENDGQGTEGPCNGGQGVAGGGVLQRQAAAAEVMAPEQQQRSAATKHGNSDSDSAEQQAVARTSKGSRWVLAGGGGGGARGNDNRYRRTEFRCQVCLEDLADQKVQGGGHGTGIRPCFLFESTDSKPCHWQRHRGGLSPCWPPRLQLMPRCCPPAPRTPPITGLLQAPQHLPSPRHWIADGAGPRGNVVPAVRQV